MIRCVGLRRSGNHAVINWLLGCFDEPRCFLNDILPGEDPFKGWDRSADMQLVQDMSRAEFLQGVNVVAFSYEDLPLGEAVMPDPKWLGAARRCIDLLVLRDPFNMYASRYRIEQDRADFDWVQVMPKADELMPLWKAYAREYLGQTRHLANNRLVVNYNSWCTDAAYREAWCRRIGVPFVDEGHKLVPGFGFGSSFTECDYNQRAHEMDVARRWMHYKDEPEFLAAFRGDEELLALSEQIFGTIGAEQLLLQRD